MSEFNENVFALDALSSALQKTKLASIEALLDFHFEKSGQKLNTADKFRLRHLEDMKERFGTIRIISGI